MIAFVFNPLFPNGMFLPTRHRLLPYVGYPLCNFHKLWTACAVEAVGHIVPQRAPCWGPSAVRGLASQVQYPQWSGPSSVDRPGGQVDWPLSNHHMVGPHSGGGAWPPITICPVGVGSNCRLALRSSQLAAIKSLWVVSAAEAIGHLQWGASAVEVLGHML